MGEEAGQIMILNNYGLTGYAFRLTEKGGRVVTMVQDINKYRHINTLVFPRQLLTVNLSDRYSRRRSDKDIRSTHLYILSSCRKIGSKQSVAAPDVKY
jgi:hypothetical protein